MSMKLFYSPVANTSEYIFDLDHQAWMFVAIQQSSHDISMWRSADDVVHTFLIMEVIRPKVTLEFDPTA